MIMKKLANSLRRGKGYWVDHDGMRQDFNLESGDVWMIPPGFENGSEGFPETDNSSEDFRIQVFNGTLAPGRHSLRHHENTPASYKGAKSDARCTTPTRAASDTSEQFWRWMVEHAVV
ncbi:hypothetical protein ACNJYD_09210 [Bradyrhizobium sp. DASA03005]|uniref:hypothetical protein n=1 Tax=Bradyrhizobium sp. SPXBL-02 TaxID=3395912 RepID=UPI003F705174